MTRYGELCLCEFSAEHKETPSQRSKNKGAVGPFSKRAGRIRALQQAILVGRSLGPPVEQSVGLSPRHPPKFDQAI